MSKIQSFSELYVTSFIIVSSTKASSVLAAMLQSLYDDNTVGVKYKDML